MAELSPLRRRMIEDMTIRNMSPATQRSYISAVSNFSRYFGRSPERLELEDVRAFQVHLVSTGISWASLNQIVCALRFFYGITLGEAEVPERIAYAREPRKLPVVLSADEVVLFLKSVSTLKSRAALTTAYAAGLRASEVAGLRVADIDSARGVILVRNGKGAKDRNVMLSSQLLGVSGILCAGPVSPSRFDEPVVEDDSELGLGLAPFAWRHFPFLRDLAQDEKQQFHRRLIGWKMTSRSHGAAEFCVQGFDGVRNRYEDCRRRSPGCGRRACGVWCDHPGRRRREHESVGRPMYSMS